MPGASIFLIVVHLHIFRGLYHASYSSPRELVWCLGVVILLLMIITAFIGYVLPWGQKNVFRIECHAANNIHFTLETYTLKHAEISNAVSESQAAGKA
ncbi:hypothetical protein RJ640_023426 [Escallonia rubra]|uniref:Cytochrome b/b6 N-terminal region profile domain-containing protein n=1 Tax=Escallonia rubra TaxID=112253 RepID=A0AA88QS43_9ASTE|nr:hypothetical protein RJ640_023426 [Escallonia rubra]